VNDVVRLLDHLSFPERTSGLFARWMGLRSRLTRVRVRSAVLRWLGRRGSIEQCLSPTVWPMPTLSSKSNGVCASRDADGLPVVQPEPDAFARFRRAGCGMEGRMLGPRVTAAGLSGTGIPILAIVGELRWHYAVRRRWRPSSRQSKSSSSRVRAMLRLERSQYSSTR
jgi:hypothetical protein